MYGFFLDREREHGVREELREVAIFLVIKCECNNLYLLSMSLMQAMHHHVFIASQRLHLTHAYIWRRSAFQWVRWWRLTQVGKREKDQNLISFIKEGKVGPW